MGSYKYLNSMLRGVQTIRFVMKGCYIDASHKVLKEGYNCIVNLICVQTPSSTQKFKA